MSATADQAGPGYAYRTPGVHFEWLDRPRAIAELRTDVAGFVGIAARGPLHEPVRLESWNQFTSTFGAHIAAGYLAYAVEAFFANGGRTCWAVRSADPDAARPATLRLDDDAGNAALELAATSPGTWGHDVTVTLSRLSPERFALAVRSADGATEMWRNLSMDPADPRFAVDVLGGPGGSRLVRARAIGPAFPARTPNARSPRLRFATARLAGGHDGLASLQPRHLSGDDSPPDRIWGLRTLEAVDEVAIVAMPDAMPKPRVAVRRRPPPPPRCDDPESEPAPPPPADEDDEFPPTFDDDDLARLQLALVRHCATLGDRFAVLDPRPGDTSPDRVLAWRALFDPSARASQYAALYYPWISAPDPARLQGLLRDVPPSGHVAGIFARSDLRVGVHKPPANERLENCNALTTSTDDARHGDLNEAGVNVIRTAGARIRLVGARTLSSDPSWRYVNVRRLLSMVEEAIDEGTAWSVFEPNAPPLWREIDRVARSFLDGLWRRGMFDGATPDEAYLVRCDETTNPPEERDVGRMSCLVGVLPPWPAEFVIVRIGATQGATRGVPDAETADG